MSFTIQGTVPSATYIDSTVAAYNQNVSVQTGNFRVINSNVLTFTTGTVAAFIDSATNLPLLLDINDVVVEVDMVGTFTGAGNVSVGVANTPGGVIGTSIASNTTANVITISQSNISVPASILGPGWQYISVGEIGGPTITSARMIVMLRVWRGNV